MLRVAFVTPGVLATLREKEGTVYGGSELRAWRFARGLADRGFQVSVMGGDDNEAPPEMLGPVSIIAPSRRASRWIDFGRILRRRSASTAPWEAAEADIYVAFGAAEYNARIGEWCRSNGRPFLLFAGSDADFSEEYRPGNANRNIWGSRCDRCYDSIMLATTLVVQSRTQQKIAKERFGRRAEVITNPVEVTSPPPDGRIGTCFLWIGKAVDNKRPELAIAVAKACPDQSFVMVLNDVGNGQFEKISAAAPPNVEIVPSIRPSQLAQYFSQACALLCTSDFEGFPNTFLDAGRFGVPVISLSVDPDGVVARERGGFVAQGDFSEFVGAVKRFAAEPDTAIAAGRRLYDYVEREHEASARVQQLAQVLTGMTASTAEGRLRTH